MTVSAKATRLTFHACEAFLCQVLRERTCRVWVSDPMKLVTPYDPARTIMLDLSKSPGDLAAAGQSIAGAEIDDYYTDGGLTRLGPRYPGAARDDNGHASDASVWLTEGKFKEAQALLVGPDYVPRPGTHSYQWQSILVANDPSNPATWRRYAGYHARRIAVDGKGRTVLKVWEALTNLTSEAGAKDVVVDLADPTCCDAVASTAFGANDQDGALFLEWSFAKERNLLSPKLPIGYAGPAEYPDYRRLSERAIAARRARLSR